MEIRQKYCPICKKEKQDNPCFSINTDTGMYYCHTNGVGGNIKDLEDYDIDIEKIKSEEKPVEIKDFYSLLRDSTTKLTEEWKHYLETRGITTKKVDNLLRVKGKALVIPIVDTESVIGIKYRSMDKKMWTETGSKSYAFLNQNAIKNYEELLIVEGEIDLLSCLECGYDNVVSLPLGAKNLKCILRQKDWLGNFNKIIIATDNDEVGNKSKEEIFNTLDDMKERLYQVDFGKYKDPNEVLVAEGKLALIRIIKNAKKISMTGEPFFEMNGCYHAITSKGIVKATDFTLEIDGYSDTLIKGKVITEEREREFKVLKSEIVSKEAIVRNWGFFLISSTRIINFVHWILEQNKSKYIPEIDYYGFHEDKFYHPGSEVICNKNDLKVNNIDGIKEITKEDKEWINNNLIYLRSDVNQSLLGICWALGRFHIQEQYPILETAGTTSIGKSEYVEFISRMMFGNKENIKSFTTLTNHQIRSISSCSNITPWVIDEVKMNNKNLKERAADLYSNLRSVYDNKTVNQGNVTSKLTEFHLKTPLIVSGETELADVSIRNRMISVKLTPHNKSKEEIFIKLKESDILEKFSKYVLEKRMENGIIKIENSEARKFLKDVNDERQIYNGKCILTGFKFLCTLIKIEDKIKQNFIEYLNELLSRAYSVEENFIQLLELVVDSGVPYEDFYIKTSTTHLAKFNVLYKAISVEHQKTNSTLELLDAKTLRQQLIECGYIEKKNVAQRINLWGKDTPVKVDIFKL